MIAVDTSALIAIVRGEPEADFCQTVLLQQEALIMAAPTITEALIVARGRGLESEMRELLEELVPTVVPLTDQRAREAAHAHER